MQKHVDMQMKIQIGILLRVSWLQSELELYVRSSSRIPVQCALALPVLHETYTSLGRFTAATPVNSTFSRE